VAVPTLPPLDLIPQIHCIFSAHHYRRAGEGSARIQEPGDAPPAMPSRILALNILKRRLCPLTIHPVSVEQSRAAK
jgi:hypothetical protein